MMMSEINTPYVPVDADFVLKDNAGAITIDENYAAQNFWKDVLIRYFRKVSAVIGLVLIILITLFAAIGPGMNEYTYSGQELSQKNFAPRVKALEKFGIFNGDESMRTTTGSKTINYYVEKGLDDVEYWFGSDNFGRDIWTRTWEGARVSLIIAIAAAIIDMVIGMSYGLISGYFGGKVDIIMQRILEIANGIPRLVIVTLLLLVLQPGMLTIIFALMLTEWVGMSRIARAEMLKLKEQEFVLASRTLGAGNFFIIFKEVLPNVMLPLVTLLGLSLGSLLGGTAVVEIIYNWPGMGNMAVKAISCRDYPLVQGYVLWIALLYMVINLIVDLSYKYLDPRLKEEK